MFGNSGSGLEPGDHRMYFGNVRAYMQQFLSGYEHGTRICVAIEASTVHSETFPKIAS